MQSSIPNTTQKRTIQAIINIFETGFAQPDYGRVTLMTGDTGHLSYGRAQFSLGSGTLYLLIKDYAAHEEALYAPALQKHLPRLEETDLSLNDDAAFRALLEAAAGDPIMHCCQDALLDRFYWMPACRAAKTKNLRLPLSFCVLYDSLVHGSWARIARRTSEKHGEPQTLGERAWIAAYLSERRAWLVGHKNALLHHTAYRVRVLYRLLQNDNWTLELPLTLRGQRIDMHRLSSRPPVPARAGDALPLLRLRRPPFQGEAVRHVAKALISCGASLAPETDLFDERLETALRAFQKERGLIVDGIVGPATRAEMNI